jgi:hypothetical protein
LWVLLLEPIDLYLCYRSLLSGRLFGPGKEPDNFLITTQQVPAAPESAAPASPTPPSLRNPLRLIALGICRSLARSPFLREAFQQWRLSCIVGSCVGRTASNHSYR